MKSILFIVLLFLSTTLIAQNSSGTDSSWALVPDSISSVIIHRDSRLDLLIKKQTEINEVTSRDARRHIKGYRLMIINTNKRDEALAAKSKVYTYFPELKAYLLYQSPYFKLKVGNFRERKDAQDYQKRLNVYFPNGVFIMNDVIEVKLEKFTDDSILP